MKYKEIKLHNIEKMHILVNSCEDCNVNPKKLKPYDRRSTHGDAHIVKSRD